MAALDARRDGRGSGAPARCVRDRPTRRRVLDAGDGVLDGFVVRAPWGGGATIAPALDDAEAILHARRVAHGPDGRVRAGVLSDNEAGLERLLGSGWAEMWRAPRLIRGDPLDLAAGSRSGASSTTRSADPGPRMGHPAGFTRRRRSDGEPCRPAAMLPTMWATIHRARRRLGGDDVGIPADRVAVERWSTPDPAAAPRHVEDIVIVLGRADIDRLRHALQTTLGDAIEQPNTPARIESALALLLSLAGSPGRPRVLRRPAGVSTPESWEIHLDGAERASGIAVRDAGRTGRFSA